MARIADPALLVCALVCALACMPGAAAEAASSVNQSPNAPAIPPSSRSVNDWLEALDRLRTLAYQDNPRALEQLHALAASVESSSSYEVRRAYLDTLIWAYFDTDLPDRAEAPIQRLQSLADQHKDPVGQLLAGAAHAHRLAATGHASDAVNGLEALAGTAQNTQDASAKWSFHVTLGVLQAAIGSFDTALSNLLVSLDDTQSMRRQADASRLRSQVQLAWAYYAMRNYAEASTSLDKAERLSAELKATQIDGYIHMARGSLASAQGQLDVALKAFEAGLRLATQTGRGGLEAAALNNIGDIHLLRHEYPEAEAYMRRALSSYESRANYAGAALARANVGFSLMGQGQIEAGASEVHEGLKQIRTSGDRRMEEVVLEEFSRMYEQAGRYREAIETTRTQQAISKELFQKDREQAVAQLQAAFDAKERQQQIDQLSQLNALKDKEISNRVRQQQILIAAAVLILLAGCVVFWLYRKSRLGNLALAEARRQAESALNEKNLFLATASHDLRQPVHAMSMMVEAIRLRNQDRSLLPLLTDLKGGMRSMSQLFNSLLDLARLESSSKAIKPVPVSLHVLMAEVTRLYREQATLKGLALRLHLPKGEAVTLADPMLLRQALSNLVHNAIRYTPHGGVLIGLRRRGSQWRIEVSDTGIGIANSDQPKLFNPYFRSDDAWEVDGAGHGLGLAVVAQCARQMGATLGVRSRVGKGSRFWLELPIERTLTAEATTSATATATPAVMAQPLPQSKAPPSGSAMGIQRCLIIDDDPSVLTAWRALLDSWQMEGRYATSGTDVQALEDDGFVPDAIFCDQRLRSGESGYGLLKSLLERYPDARGAMLSGEHQATDLMQAEDDGYLVLQKPLDPTTLRSVLDGWSSARQGPAR